METYIKQNPGTGVEDAGEPSLPESIDDTATDAAVESEE